MGESTASRSFCPGAHLLAACSCDTGCTKTPQSLEQRRSPHGFALPVLRCKRSALRSDRKTLRCRDKLNDWGGLLRAGWPDRPGIAQTEQTLGEGLGVCCFDWGWWYKMGISQQQQSLKQQPQTTTPLHPRHTARLHMQTVPGTPAGVCWRRPAMQGDPVWGRGPAHVLNQHFELVSVVHGTPSRRVCTQYASGQGVNVWGGRGGVYAS